MIDRRDKIPSPGTHMNNDTAVRMLILATSKKLQVEELRRVGYLKVQVSGVTTRSAMMRAVRFRAASSRSLILPNCVTRIAPAMSVVAAYGEHPERRRSPAQRV